jgi:hypothetical protein
LRLRHGQRRFALQHGPVLDYGGLGALSVTLADHECDALELLLAGGLERSLAPLLEADRLRASRRRVERMRRSGEVLAPGEF